MSDQIPESPDAEEFEVPSEPKIPPLEPEPKEMPSEETTPEPAPTEVPQPPATSGEVLQDIADDAIKAEEVSEPEPTAAPPEPASEDMNGGFGQIEDDGLTLKEQAMQWAEKEQPKDDGASEDTKAGPLPSLSLDDRFDRYMDQPEEERGERPGRAASEDDIALARKERDEAEKEWAEKNPPQGEQKAEGQGGDVNERIVTLLGIISETLIRIEQSEDKGPTYS